MRRQLKDFDYIVIGAGASGCVLAGRLAAGLPDARIALLEPGEHTASSSIDRMSPDRWPCNLGGPADYSYETTPQMQLAHRQLLYSRGRGLGGSTLLNAMLYSRGFQEDWDRMPLGWRSADVGPYFALIERKLRLREVRAGSLGNAVADAAQSIGIQGACDGVWESDGTSSRYRSTIDQVSGNRVDIYRAFGADRANIELIHGTAARLLFDDQKTAVAVELVSGEALQLARNGEVLLAAGSVDTPKLLQLSGIGPAKLLEQFGIPLVRDLPTGDRLCDHPLLPCIFMQKKFMPPALSNLAPNSVQGWVHSTDLGIKIDIIDGRSAAHIAGWGLLNMLRRPGVCWRVLYMVTWLVSTALAWMLWICPKLAWLFGGIVGLNVSLLQPTSRGTVKIQSSNPLASASVDPNFLHTDQDKRTMRAGLGLVKQLAATAPLVDRLMGILPGLIPLADAAHIESNTATYYHPTGSCAIDFCVDETLCVYGVAQVRVCDGSVLTVHPRAPTAASCMMIGARAAELVLSTRTIAAELTSLACKH